MQVISTMADENQVKTFLEFNSKSIWTEELEGLLVEGKLDVVVHCLKGRVGFYFLLFFILFLIFNFFFFFFVSMSMVFCILAIFSDSLSDSLSLSKDMPTTLPPSW